MLHEDMIAYECRYYLQCQRYVKLYYDMYDIMAFHLNRYLRIIGKLFGEYF